MKRDKKFLIIDSRPFGLFSILLHTIDNIKWAEDNGYIPVVRWGPGRWNPNFMRPGVDGNVKEKVNLGHPIGGPIDATNFLIPSEHDIFTTFSPPGFEETGFMGGIKRCLYSENDSDNPWEYYFEPLNEYTVEDALNSEHKVSDIFQVGTRELSFDVNKQFIIGSLNDYNPLVMHNLIRTSFANPSNKAAIFSYTYHKGKIFETLKKIKIKKDIIDKITKFKKENFTTNFTLGIHIRGTDKAGERHEKSNFGLRLYLSSLEFILTEHPDAKVFVATDSQEIIDILELIFSKERILSYSSFRMEKYNDAMPIPLSDNAGKKRGEEALIEALLISQCDHIIGSDSNMSMCPLYFNSQAKFTFIDSHTKVGFVEGRGIISHG